MPVGIDKVHYDILRFLSEKKAPSTINEMENLSGIQISTSGFLRRLNTLSKNGWVSCGDPFLSYDSSWRITEKGRYLLLSRSTQP